MIHAIISFIILMMIVFVVIRVIALPFLVLFGVTGTSDPWGKAKYVSEKVLEGLLLIVIGCVFVLLAYVASYMGIFGAFGIGFDSLGKAFSQFFSALIGLFV